MYKGIAASRGIGIGSICRIIEQDLSFETKMITDAAAEKARFQKAIDDFVEETYAMAEDVKKNTGEKEFADYVFEELPDCTKMEKLNMPML